MFSMREFIRKGLLDAVGKLADYQIILNAAGWMEKGVLTEADLASIQTAMEKRQRAAESDAEPEKTVGGTDETKIDATPEEEAAEAPDEKAEEEAGDRP